jgi:ATP-dependent Zn protease
MLYVPVPTPDDRASILKALSTKIKLGPDVDLDKIAHSPRAEGYSGADCAALLRESGLAVLKEDINGADPTSLSISQRHFEYAFDHVVPSVSAKDQARYDRMRSRMAHARSRGAVVAEQNEEEPADAHIDITIEAQTDNAVVLGGDTSQLSNPSEAAQQQPPSDVVSPQSVKG